MSADSEEPAVFSTSPTPDADVRAFHDKFGFPIDRDLSREGLGIRAADREKNAKINPSRLLTQVADIIDRASKQMLQYALAFQKVGDERTYRAHLIMEEVGEVLQALAERDAISLADGLADLKYVVHGTAVTYGLPLDQLFLEIHESNMTKTRTDGDPRMKAKDPAKGYRSPDIQKILDAHGTMGENHDS